MPELPEIETICRSLQPFVEQKRVVAIDVFETRLRQPLPVALLDRDVKGSTILSIRRRSKYLLFDLDNGAKLIIHLGMSGRLGLVAAQQPRESHTHLIFTLCSQQQLRFRDPRRFGLVTVQEPGHSHHPLLQHLGVEPLSPHFNADYLHNCFQNRSRPVKNALMDASLVVGLGNIYVSEALFSAGINPCRRANRLAFEEIDKLVQAIKSTLDQAIFAGGTTLNDFRNSRGDPGFFQQQLMVYQRHGQPCKVCGRQIEKCVLSGRSTFFCPECQAE